LPGMRFRSQLAALSLLFLVACSGVGVVPHEQLSALEGEKTVRLFYPSSGGNVEAYVVRPRGKGPFPLVVLLHGHSLSGRGAEQVLPTAEAFATEVCFASVAISLPGYGATEVADGPIEEVTRQVVKDGVAFARQIQWVDKRRVFFYGVSRGAIVAAAMLNDVEGVSGAILYSGAYDLNRLYRETPSFWVRQMLNPNHDANPKLLSLLGDGPRWRVPTLILHGEQDKLIPVNQALLLRDWLKAGGTDPRLVLYPDQGHFLPRANVRERTLSFLKEISASACPAIGDP
jgi:dipeptidyl aminopeptidase/acylaminoacyl peptidase